MRKMLNVQAAADTAAIRTGTYNGKEHRIVPLIALVEGVLHSANAEHPELALSSEFGKHPQSWNGRPVVMNHPKVNDEYVSANSPEVLEEWSYGHLFNTRLEDGKLKTEAWLDVEKINTAGGEIKDILDSIENGEMLEVSTGLFASVEESSGRFNGSDYEGIWRSIVSDHLAILSKGVKGACSIEDGAGIPRLNQYRMESLEDQTEDDQMALDKKKLRTQKQEKFLQGLFANAVPEDMPVDSIRTLLSSALEERFPDNVYYVHTFTSNKVVFELWDSMDLFALGYSIGDDDKVVLDSSDPTKVNILSRIVTAEEGIDINLNASDEAQTLEKDETEMSVIPNTDGAESENNAQTAKDQAPAVQSTQTDAVTETPAEPAVQSTPTEPTVEEYLAAAPAAIRDSLQAGMRLHEEQKNKLIEGILANERNAFDRETLEGFDIDMLTKVSSLAKVPTFVGNEGVQGRANSQESNVVPAPLEAFPRTVAS